MFALPSFPRGAWWLLAGIVALSADPVSNAFAADIATLPVPAWAFPGPGAPSKSLTTAEADRVVSLPGSTAHFSRGSIGNAFTPPDWWPDSHPAMPPIVANGRKPKLFACAYCHLPDGSGRPENAVLAGLPAAYIQQQIAALADGSRQLPPGDAYAPAAAMRKIAAEATPQEIAEAAAYFSRLRVAPKLSVREAATVPKSTAWHYILLLDPSASEPVGHRIIETTESVEGHELRDSRQRYVAYVPVGAIARGRALATHGPDGPATSCFVCHGPDLRGTPTAPPLAGHFATYLFRQLLSFRNGTRHDPLAALMQPVVAKLTEDEMVDLAAFAAAQAR